MESQAQDIKALYLKVTLNDTIPLSMRDRERFRDIDRVSSKLDKFVNEHMYEDAIDHQKVERIIGLYKRVEELLAIKTN